MEKVILVNEKNEAIGEMEKLLAHQKGELHRAFSVFVFNAKGELILQQRALNKYHSGGLWTNTCCSHPKPNENTLAAGKRRLQEEMGFTCELTQLFTFTYKAHLNNQLIEHEYDHVLIGKFDGIPKINTEEALNFKFCSLDWIAQDIVSYPNQYTAWFKICFDKLKEMIKLKVA